MKFYLNNKKITQKAAKELFGEADIKNKVKEAKQTWSECPWIETAWYTPHGTFIIEKTK